MEYSIQFYKTSNGKVPFKQWLKDLANMKARVAIELRLDRLEMGNFGQIRSLGGGLYEMKIDIGPGYRIYFSKIGQLIVLLLCAGDKRSQHRDIIKAQEYLKDYKQWEQKND
ncbi:MAG: type II toxin-antitoxin system RelE/ParE family toxin [Candidatus Babeliales bacterium]|jgi:putative addiction module killer protein